MRFAFHKSALLLGAAAIMAPAAATAQVNLDAAESDVRVFQGNVTGEAVTYQVSIPADSIMQIDVIATSDLDPIVTVTDAASGEVIAEDDDGGGELNSRVRIRGESGRRIVISVDSFDATWVAAGETYGGTFDLRLSTSAFVAPQTRRVTYGSRETGSINGEPNLFTFQANAGDMIQVALLSEGELDPYLELQDTNGEAIAFDDDGGNGLNSLLTHVFDTAGTYTIAATGFAESTGEYTLRVRDRREAVAQLPLQVIGIGDPATGELAAPYAPNASLPTSILYQLSDAAKAAIRRGNGEVTIRMNAVAGGDPDFGGEIDPYIEVGYDTPLGFAIATSDDDGSGSLNSMLPLDLGLIADQPALLDMLRIRVQGYGGSGGQYTLEITEGMEARVVQNYDEYDIAPPQPMMIAPAE